MKTNILRGSAYLNVYFAIFGEPANIVSPYMCPCPRAREAKSLLDINVVSNVKLNLLYNKGQL